MKKTKLLTSLAAFVLVLGLGACEGDVNINVGDVDLGGSSSDTEDTESSEANEPTLPVLGEVDVGSYFLGFTMDNVDYYFDGTVYNTNYAGVTSEIGLAVPVTVAAIDSGYSLAFTEDEATVYLNMTESENYRNIKWGSEVYSWGYDTTYSTFVALDSTGVYQFIGTYGTYKDLTLSDYGYLTGDVETSNAQYPAKLYKIPDDWEPTTGRDDEGLSSVTIEGATLLGTYDFSKSELTGVTGAFGATKDGSATGPTQEEVLKIFADAYVAGAAQTSPLADVSYNSYVYKGAGGGSSNSGLQLSEACLKLGNSSDNGELTLTYEGYTLSNVVVTAAGWNNTTTTLSVNETAQTLTQAANALSYVDEVETYTYELSDATTLKLAGSARVLIFGIAIYGEEAAADPETESVTGTSDTFGEMNADQSEEDYYLGGLTYTYLTSCNISFDSGTFTRTRLIANSAVLYGGATITFTPKDDHRLVGIELTYNSVRTTGTELVVLNSAASITCSSTGAVISEIVDGSAALTIQSTYTDNSSPVYIQTFTFTYY